MEIIQRKPRVISLQGRVSSLPSFGSREENALKFCHSKGDSWTVALQWAVCFLVEGRQQLEIDRRSCRLLLSSLFLSLPFSLLVLSKQDLTLSPRLASHSNLSAFPVPTSSAGIPGICHHALLSAWLLPCRTLP